MFKYGDKVKLKSYEGYTEYKSHRNEIATVTGYGNQSFPVGIVFPDGFISNAEESNLILILNNDSMNIKEQFSLALTPEPFKSFRKAGITNGDDLLTDDGQKIFLSWLLKSKFADEFKAAVIDPILEDQDCK